MREPLIKATHSAEFLRKDLQEALSKADAVSALLLIPMLGQVAQLEHQISALLEARNAKVQS